MGPIFTPSLSLFTPNYGVKMRRIYYGIMLVLVVIYPIYDVLLHTDCLLHLLNVFTASFHKAQTCYSKVSPFCLIFTPVDYIFLIFNCTYNKEDLFLLIKSLTNEKITVFECRMHTYIIKANFSNVSC